MLYISKITNDPQQSMILTGLQGKRIAVALRYLPRVRQWIMDISDGVTTVNGLVITNSPNILRQWRNTFGFGIMCLRLDGLDPYALDDFANRVASLYLLDADDVAAIETEFFA
jgi:hypothetical protein